MKIFDISMELKEKMLYYPGDPKMDVNIAPKSLNTEWNLSEISLGVHNGTHVDTPNHLGDKYLSKGLDIELNKCYGEAIVMDFSEIPFGKSIGVKDLEKYSISNSKIVLLKTKNSTILNKEFRKDFVYLSNEGAQFLLNAGVKTIGIDYLSIGPRDTHETILLNGILIYEGLNLKHIKPNFYLFIGFPLKLNTEGIPVRAILIKE